jgi:hypothetical protein
MIDIALGVQAKFKQVLPEEYQLRLEAAGWPKHAAHSTTELCSIVGSGVIYLESEGIIKARDVFTIHCEPDRLIHADSETRSSIRLTNSRPGRNTSRKQTGAASYECIDGITRAPSHFRGRWLMIIGCKSSHRHSYTLYDFVRLDTTFESQLRPLDKRLSDSFVCSGFCVTLNTC